MDTRRALFAGIVGMAAAAAAARRTGLAQTAPAGPQGGRGGAADDGGLADRGAPAGRIGAATRSGAQSADGGLALDLVAPLRGVGLASADQPTLLYLLSGRTAGPLRLAVSTPGQARPLANVELPRPQQAGLGVVRLRDHGVRLPADTLCVWSVTVALDPRAPSRDLVASALIRHRPADPALDAALREPSPERRVAALARAGYWYDAAALAEQNQARDRGAALAWLFEQAALRPAAASSPGAAATSAR